MLYLPKHRSGFETSEWVISSSESSPGPEVSTPGRDRDRDNESGRVLSGGGCRSVSGGVGAERDCIMIGWGVRNTVDAEDEDMTSTFEGNDDVDADVLIDSFLGRKVVSGAGWACCWIFPVLEGTLD